MVIIQLEELYPRDIQSQSHRTTCWIPGYIEVPSHLETKIWDSRGYCDLVIENGILVDVIKNEIPAPVKTIEDQIAELQQQLADTDYKIIKCSEYQLAGKELPYDIAELHEERQHLRDEINKLS